MAPEAVGSSPIIRPKKLMLIHHINCYSGIMNKQNKVSRYFTHYPPKVLASLYCAVVAFNYFLMRKPLVEALIYSLVFVLLMTIVFFLWDDRKKH